jgi:hypothetical protein
MTLEPYDLARLDALTLRLLDLCGRVRSIARTAQEAELPAVELHDRKALEWVEKLEEWVAGAEAQLHRQASLAKGARKARDAQSRSR